MNEQQVQIIVKDGAPEYAVIPIEAYRRMAAALEDAEDSAAIDRAWADDAAGDTVPGDVVKAILNGGSPLRAWRKHRGLTLASLAAQAGVSRGYLSQIENGHKAGALDVSMDHLVEPVSDPGSVQDVEV